MDKEKEVTINVTREHIRQGRRRDCEACFMALALKEAAQAGCAKASYRSLEFQLDDSGTYVAETPRGARRRMINFDNKGTPRPFEITLKFKREVPQ